MRILINTESKREPNNDIVIHWLAVTQIHHLKFFISVISYSLEYSYMLLWIEM